MTTLPIKTSLSEIPPMAEPEGVAVEASDWDPVDDWAALSGEPVQAEKPDAAAVQAAIEHGDMPAERRAPRAMAVIVMLIIQVYTLPLAAALYSAIRGYTSYAWLRELFHWVDHWKWVIEVMSVAASSLPLLICYVAFVAAWMHLTHRRYREAISYSLLPIIASILSPVIMGLSWILVHNVTALW